MSRYIETFNELDASSWHKPPSEDSQKRPLDLSNTSLRVGPIPLEYWEAGDYSRFIQLSAQSAHNSAQERRSRPAYNVLPVFTQAQLTDAIPQLLAPALLSTRPPPLVPRAVTGRRTSYAPKAVSAFHPPAKTRDHAKGAPSNGRPILARPMPAVTHTVTPSQTPTNAKRKQSSRAHNDTKVVCANRTNDAVNPAIHNQIADVAAVTDDAAAPDDADQNNDDEKIAARVQAVLQAQADAKAVAQAKAIVAAQTQRQLARAQALAHITELQGVAGGAFLTSVPPPNYPLYHDGKQ
ncbi:uncharacterized protein LOC113500170 [Trichoplusia ni]|uniref:Uncharacterized protein LOC113500170 n=1 Tax=Trichoplusia ni TaxID=7111 RepID=A0A7E5W7S8_TRINI|nr:uncharacterized protein LOC113500170 [Trichoplusia ni]